MGNEAKKQILTKALEIGIGVNRTNGLSYQFGLDSLINSVVNQPNLHFAPKLILPQNMQATQIHGSHNYRMKYLQLEWLFMIAPL
ncbi:unnamed protein product [Protopolystoma xenopodis]|uniref:Uncharacterized protein n=1 Tax=Protopolystoma xenopodis TaxID=117903 RepID=A0A3S5FBZ2_9PLAT|nr:unnamed protein product [Protopolystoma xenopodis]